MKLMRYTLVCLLCLLLVSAVACGARNAANSSTPSPAPITSTSPAPSTVEVSATPAPAGDAQVFTGTVDEIKDFLIIASDEKGDAYVFGNEGLNSHALDDIKVGDQVRITYTGDLTTMYSSLVSTAIEKVA